MAKLKVTENNGFEIEKNVPILRRPGGSGRPSKYPFAQMDVGDSFFVAGQSTVDGAAKAAHGHARSYNKRFTARTTDGGVRIWRVE